MDLPASRPAPLDWSPSASALSSLRRSFVQTKLLRDRISNLLSICFTLRLIIRSRLTLGGSTFPRNPWTFGEYDSCILCVTHADILSSIQFTTSCRYGFLPNTTLPYQSYNKCTFPSFGAMLSPRYFRRDNPRPVSCYALFKGWLLLSQPPGCSGIITSLLHLA